MQKQFNVIQLPSDTSGCSWYRLLMPQYTLESGSPEINFSISRRFITDVQYFTGVNTIMAQRQVSNPQEIYFNKFLHPLSKAKGSWLIYNIDDCIHKDDIPRYNKAWPAYQVEGLMDNVKLMLHNADFVLVTTDELKQYYINKFDVPEESMLVIPNYLPKWWIGQYYNLDNKVAQYNHNKKKPRVGIISSGSHFNTHDAECKEHDDLDLIYDTIVKTTQKYQWVMLGVPHPKLMPLIQQGVIQFAQGSDILHYPKLINDLQLQAVVAPLQDNTFNRCKSNIKLLEGAALGVPVIASDLPVYSKYTDWTFKDNDELQAKLSDLLSVDKYHYKKIVQANYDFMNTPHEDAPRGWWLENNIAQWAEVYKMRAKAIEFDYTSYAKKKAEDDKPKLSLYKNDGLEIVT